MILDRLHTIIQDKAHAFALHIAVHVAGHVIVQRRDDLVLQFNERDL